MGPTIGNNAPVDEFTALCRRCGYVIDGLPAGSACPECGLDSSRSLASSRPGSPWQRRPGPASWLWTNLLALVRPGTLFDRVAIDPRSSVRLLAWNIAAATLLLAAQAALGLRWILPVPRNLPAWQGVLATAALAPMVLVLLTWVEARGIRVFGTRAGGRVTRAVAWTVVAHASVGWIVAALLVAPARLVVQHGKTYWWDYDLIPAWADPVVRTAVLLLGLVLGLLAFEVLTYVGVRRCRFANRERPRVEAGAGPAGGAEPA